MNDLFGSYLLCWRRYAVFHGRARRREFWAFTLGNILVYAALYWLWNDSKSPLGFGIAVFAFVYIAVIPEFAVLGRRLHDIGLSARWLLIVFIPYLGVLTLLGMTFIAGKPTANKWGPPPGESSEIAVQ